MPLWLLVDSGGHRGIFNGNEHQGGHREVCSPKLHMVIVPDFATV